MRRRQVSKQSLRTARPLLVALWVAAPLSAQVVQGRVLDDASGQPVASAAIQLLEGEEGDLVLATGATDEQGHFVLRAPASGTYRLRTSRIGYQPVTTRPFDIEGEDPLQVEVRISAVAVPLEPLTIMSERAARPSLRLENVGYYERREQYGREGLGLGEFLEQEEIRRYNPTQVSDALRMVRGVMVEGAGGRRQVITLRAHGSRSTTGRCIPQVFVDGVPAATGRNVDQLISPWSLAAVEVYAGLSVPARFWRDAMDVDPGAAPGMWQSKGGPVFLPACGAIVLWTGYGGPDNRDPEPASPVSDQALVAKSTLLALDLTLAMDSVALGATLRTTLTISNLFHDSRSLCVVESRYTLRGTKTNRDIVEGPHERPCVRDLNLPGQGSHSWQEVVSFLAGLDEPGDVVIQKHIRLRYEPCGQGQECEVSLRSAPQWFTLHPDGGATW